MSVDSKVEKAIFKSLIKGLKSQNNNRNQSLYAYFISIIEFLLHSIG